jgi:ankyrin repeat protein
VLEGDLEAHRCSIQIIREERGADDHGFVRFVTDDLLKELDKHPGEREFDALVHACAMNDLAALRRRLHSTEVYAEGDCGLALLGVAIACSHPRAVAFLLQHGLDPSIDLTQETLLHMAAPLRRGEPAMVRALLEHGANPHLHDKEGHTALSIAEEFNRHENARMLRAFGAK